MSFTDKLSIIKFSGKTKWFKIAIAKEGVPWNPHLSIFVDEITDDNLNLLFVPQYRINLNLIG